MSAIVSKNLVSQIIEVDPDDLISGSGANTGMYEVVLRTPGEYKRGELLMLSGNQYVKATSAGVASAASLVLLCDDVTFSENEYAQEWAYSSGRFLGSKIVLPYETENDSHDELLESIKPVLMRMKIYID